MMRGVDSLFANLIVDAQRTLEALKAHEATFEKMAGLVVSCLRDGGKLLTCGNGGSAADAMHLAEELVGRYCRDRRSLPAICLNADATLLTCIGNDYGFEEVFARQVEGLGVAGDVLVCFTTSGQSANIVRALEAGKARGLKTVALLGKDGGRARGRADVELIVPSQDTARVQEAHTLILHALLERVERDAV
jgi:D-sedoheptulose 7-phosphate isomerase